MLIRSSYILHKMTSLSNRYVNNYCLLTGTDAGLQTVTTSGSFWRTETPEAITGGSCLQCLWYQFHFQVLSLRFKQSIKSRNKPMYEMAYFLRWFNNVWNWHHLAINLYPSTFHSINLQCSERTVNYVITCFNSYIELKLTKFSQISFLKLTGNIFQGL